jgi:hypothetical protein
MNLIPPAYAEVNIQSIFGPTKDNGFLTLGSLVNVLLPNILTIAGIIAFLAVIVTGLKVISSSGDAKAQESSKGAFTAAMIGLIIIFGAYFFIQIFETITGIPLLQLAK